MNLVKWFQNNLLNTDKLMTLGEVILKIIIIFIIAKLFIRFSHIVIEKMFRLRLKSHILRYNERKEVTLKKVCQSIIVYVTYFLSVMLILETLGMNMKVLLAGISIAGLITGLGVQSVIKDILTGFFILFEDQFSVGDKVKINDTEGIVEEIGLRITKIRGIDGEYYFFANSNITKVANFTLGDKQKEIISD